MANRSHEPVRPGEHARINVKAYGGTQRTILYPVNGFLDEVDPERSVPRVGTMQPGELIFILAVVGDYAYVLWKDRLGWCVKWELEPV